MTWKFPCTLTKDFKEPFHGFAGVLLFSSCSFWAMILIHLPDPGVIILQSLETQLLHSGHFRLTNFLKPLGCTRDYLGESL